MRCNLIFLIIIGVCLSAGMQPARADLFGVPASNALSSPGMMCRRAINAAARSAGIPDHLMAAIGRVESGRRSADGVMHPWPWSINVEGIDHVYDTREQVIAAVRGFQAQGIRSIDVGCMQVNLLQHPDAFTSLEQAFDPASNAAYAARFLGQLFSQTGTWPKATAGYHSLTPGVGEPYERKVNAVMAEETATDMATLGSGNPGVAGRVGGAMPLFAAGSGALMLGNRSEAAHIIPLAGAGMARGLDAYRAAPVRVAGRM